MSSKIDSCEKIDIQGRAFLVGSYFRGTIYFRGFTVNKINPAILNEQDFRVYVKETLRDQLPSHVPYSTEKDELLQPLKEHQEAT